MHHEKNISFSFSADNVIILSWQNINQQRDSSENIYYQKLESLEKKNISDSAFYYYNLAKDDYLKSNDSIGIAESLINMAIIQTHYGILWKHWNIIEANTFLKNENDSIAKRDLASNYNNMGIASSFV